MPDHDGHPGGSPPSDPDEGSGHPGGHPSASPPGNSNEGGPDGHPGGSPMGGRDFSRTPLIATWEVSQACDLECDHCRADAQPDRDPDELSTAEGKRLIDDVAGFGTPGPVFVFSGGDPLKRPDLFELAEYAIDQGLPTAVTPAPTDLLTRDVVERFADVGIRRMALSLDGGDAESHDGFRGEEGSFERIRRVAGWADDAGLPIQINTTVTANTVDDMPAIADLVEGLGAVMWEVFFLVPVGRGEELAQITPAQSDEFMAWLYRRQKEPPFRVITVEAPHYRRVAQEVADEDVRVGSTGAGNGFIFVSHTGDVYPSGFLSESVGNVREESLVDLYRDAPLLEALRDPDGFHGVCGECEYRDLCGGSRSRAYATTGDPLASDPLCPLVANN
ncbi:MAG: radical SAM protein with 4Fe4S-binding SPASM domain [Halobacteriales archaeon]|jgi:radical SAM protein with 4Fe4S-binding SPASM domain